MTIQTTKRNGIARVTFRVRCETLGHGECVYLHQDGSNGQVSYMALQNKWDVTDLACWSRFKLQRYWFRIE